MTKIQRGAVVRTANAWDDFSVGTLTATIAAVALTANTTPIMEVIVQNDPDSAEAAFVGNIHRQDFQLNAGSTVTIPVNDLSKVYVKSAAGGAIVNWMAGT